MDPCALEVEMHLLAIANKIDKTAYKLYYIVFKVFIMLKFGKTNNTALKIVLFCFEKKKAYQSTNLS